MHKALPIALSIVLGGVAIATDQTNAPASATAEPEARPDITTLSGVTYEHCKVTEVKPDGIKVFHAKGIATIPFTDLADTYREKYRYDAQKAEEYRNALAREQALLRWKKSIKHFAGKLAVGQNGTVDGRIKITQVIDDRNLLAEIPHKVKKIENISVPMDRGDGRIIRVGQPTEIVDTEYTLVWISGIPTGKVVDGQWTSLPGAYTINSTRTYETAVGTRTVFVLEPAKPPSE